MKKPKAIKIKYINLMILKKVQKLQNQFINKIIKLIINENPNFVFDSRLIKKGDIFIGIKTKNDDGSNYAELALSKGCSLAIINKNIINKKIIFVPDVLEFLIIVTSKILKSYNGKIIAITGSVGKTTLKENLFLFLKREKIKSYKSYKNFNNELGLITNILNMDLNTSFSLFEVGISKMNEMDRLTNILNPHYVLITNIEDSHIGNFRSYKNLVKNKLLLLKSNRLISALVNFNKNFSLIPPSYTSNAKIKFINLKNDIIINSINDNKKSFLIDFNFHNKAYKIRSESNNKISCNIAIISFFFVNILMKSNIFKKFFFKASFLKGHGNIINIDINNHKYQIYDHSYNASPYSLKENLSHFLNMPDYNKNDIIIIGSMKELGTHSLKSHNDIIYMLRNFANIFFIGDEFNKLLKSHNPYGFKFYKNNVEFLPILKNYINKSKKIFIMGSRSNKLDMIVDELC